MNFTILKWHNILKHTPKPGNLLLIKNIMTLNYDFAIYLGNKFMVLGSDKPKQISKNVVYEWAYIPEVKINAK